MNSLIQQLRTLGAGVVGLLLTITVITFGAMSWTNVSAEVELTVHNLGTSGPAGSNTFGTAPTSGTADVCVFCHTPHGGATGAGISVPLWNRTLAAPTDYTTYATLNSSTLEGAVAPVGSVSIACLSCHDGTQAMDSVLNEPGSGLTNATYSAGNWTGPNQNAGQLINAPNLGQDISNDHPIGIQYGGGGVTAAAPGGALNDLDFVAPQFTPINTVNVFWVDTGTTGIGTREKTDMILYNRTVAGIDGGQLQPFVECASCHDPHSNANPTFLRASNDNSAVCLACHSK